MTPKVLVVDDDAEFTELITYTLEKQGCRVVAAADGVQGLNQARTELPDVILLDLMLPDLDGLSVFQILRSQPSTRTIPVLIVSALGESWATVRGRAPRYERYLKKPINLKELSRFVHAAASGRMGGSASVTIEKKASPEADRRAERRHEHARTAPPRQMLQ